MKKIFFILFLLIMSGCSLWQNNDLQDARKDKNTYPRLTTEPLYSLEGSEETSQMYSVVAARVTNTMLKQTSASHTLKEGSRIYVRPIKKTGVDHIPDGFYHTSQVTKDIISGSKIYILTDRQENADYILDISVSRINIEGMQGDVIQYKMILLDKGDNELGRWMESIRQVQNDDRSWW